MPDMQQAVQQINGALGASLTARDGGPTFPDGGDVLDFFESLPGVELTTAAKDFMRTWPSAIAAALGAAIADNLQRDPTERVPIALSWTPGYDFSMTIWDVRNTASTHGELTIHLTSRYPGDPHPLDAASFAALE